MGVIWLLLFVTVSLHFCQCTSPHNMPVLLLLLVGYQVQRACRSLREIRRRKKQTQSLPAHVLASLVEQKYAFFAFFFFFFSQAAFSVAFFRFKFVLPFVLSFFVCFTSPSLQSLKKKSYFWGVPRNYLLDHKI